MKCSELLNKFLIEQEVKGNSKETIIYYKKRITYFINFIHDKDISNVNFDDYNNYVIYFKSKITKNGNLVSNATVKTSVNSVKIFLTYAYNNKYTSVDFTKIKPYKLDKKTIVVLSSEEIQKLLSSQNEFTLLGVRNLLAISLMLDARFTCF